MADFDDKECEAPLGDWPIETSYESGLSVAYTLTGQPKSSMHIALIPTDDPTAIPAFMRFGNWNACPPPAYHVAALRDWRDRYGAELIGLGADTINLRVSRKPATREEVLEIARAIFPLQRHHRSGCPLLSGSGRWIDGERLAVLLAG